MPKNSLVVESIPEIRLFPEWNPEMISQVLADEIAIKIANALFEVFRLSSTLLKKYGVCKFDKYRVLIKTQG